MEHVAVNPLASPFDEILIQISLDIEQIRYFSFLAWRLWSLKMVCCSFAT